MSCPAWAIRLPPPLKPRLYNPSCRQTVVKKARLGCRAFSFSSVLQVIRGAPGRIRTCDRRIRSPLLCPLSYGRIRLIYAEFSTSGSSRKPRCQQYVSSSPSESLVHSFGQPAIHTLDNVAIRVESNVYAGVAQELLDELGVLACHEEYCSASVAQIVEPDGWESRLLQQRLEVPPRQVRAAHGCTYGRGEHQVVILPQRTCL